MAFNIAKNFDEDCFKLFNDCLSLKIVLAWGLSIGAEKKQLSWSNRPCI